MRLVRNNLAATTLALFALVAQLVVSFGHVHLPGHSHAQLQAKGAPHTHYGVRDYGHADTWGTASSETANSVDCAPTLDTTCPAPRHGDDPANCVICWTVTVALMLPSAAATGLPPARAGPVRANVYSPVLTGHDTTPYQSRAPPVA